MFIVYLGDWFLSFSVYADYIMCRSTKCVLMPHGAPFCRDASSATATARLRLHGQQLPSQQRDLIGCSSTVRFVRGATILTSSAEAEG